MHELSICQSMLDIVERTMRGHPGATLKVIRLDIGKGSTIESLLLRDAFAIITEGGPFEGTELDINDIPIVGRCRACESSFTYQEMALGCPSCGSTDIVIESGMELDIRELEIDEPDSED
ncbi:hydrogenase maturation nickel metallochaperone HypA [bacterium]|nr:hydrogenase maturation nickel metallochaperone HypA [bacterium]